MTYTIVFVFFMFTIAYECFFGQKPSDIEKFLHFSSLEQVGASMPTQPHNHIIQVGALILLLHLKVIQSQHFCKKKLIDIDFFDNIDGVNQSAMSVTLYAKMMSESLITNPLSKYIFIYPTYYTVPIMNIGGRYIESYSYYMTNEAPVTNKDDQLLTDIFFWFTKKRVKKNWKACIKDITILLSIVPNALCFFRPTTYYIILTLIFLRFYAIVLCTTTPKVPKLTNKGGMKQI
ncbi:hypothetical protein ACJX0J_013687, partial [Zea mays]